MSESTPPAAMSSELLAGLGERDRLIVDRAELLTPQSMPRLYAEPPAAAPAAPSADLAELAARIAAGARPGLATAAATTVAVSRLAQREPDGADREAIAIYESGAANWIERARLLAALLQATGLPARVCLLLGGERPQAVVETPIMNGWAVFDPMANQYFVYTHKGYASAWDIQRRPAIVDQHPDHGRKPTIDSRYYRVVRIAPAGVSAA